MGGGIVVEIKKPDSNRRAFLLAEGKMYVRASKSRQRAVFGREKMVSRARIVITLL